MAAINEQKTEAGKEILSRLNSKEAINAYEFFDTFLEGVKDQTLKNFTFEMFRRDPRFYEFTNGYIKYKAEEDQKKKGKQR